MQIASLFLYLLNSYCITISTSDESLQIKDVEIVMDQTLDKSVRIEDDGRNFTLPVDTELIKEAADLLQRFKSPPPQIKEIVDNIYDKKESEEEMMRSGKVTFIVFFLDTVLTNKNDVKFDLKVDAKLSKQANIYISTDKERAKELNVPFPGVYGFYAPDSAEYRIEFTTFTQCVSIILSPIFSELTVDTLKMYDDSQLPKFFLFYEEEQQNKFYEQKKEYESVVKKYKETVKSGLLPYKKDKASLGHFGITSELLPAIVCVVDRKKYRGVNLTPEKLDKVLSEYKNGTLKPYELSSDEPFDNDKRFVKEITRNSYKKYFYLEESDKSEENDKDALIVFTSPHCKFCVDLKPVLESIGKLASENASEFVIVGNINMTLNDFPEFNVVGYPTITLISNMQVHYFNGARTVEDLCEFIKDKGFYGIDIKTGARERKEETKVSEVEIGEGNEKDDL